MSPAEVGCGWQTALTTGDHYFFAVLFLELFRERQAITVLENGLRCMGEQEPADVDLLRAMQDGDEAAFVALYQRWQGRIFRFALQMRGSRAAAEDVTQEVFMALIRDSRGYMASRGTFGAWLYGIARHMIRRAIDREKAPAISLNDAEGSAQVENLPSSCGDPHDATVQKQRTDRLRIALLSLPIHYREVLVLCELHEMNYAETARSLGCRIGTVRSRLHRARAMLAERLRSGGLKTSRPLSTIAPDGCAL